MREGFTRGGGGGRVRGGAVGHFIAWLLCMCVGEQIESKRSSLSPPTSRHVGRDRSSRSTAGWLVG